ncbi:DUF6455 family protein [Thermocrispum municipale]
MSNPIGAKNVTRCRKCQQSRTCAGWLARPGRRATGNQYLAGNSVLSPAS